jgi:hypothetical protein
MERGHPVRPRVARGLSKAPLLAKLSGLCPLADSMSAIRLRLIPRSKPRAAEWPAFRSLA